MSKLALFFSRLFGSAERAASTATQAAEQRDFSMKQPLPFVQYFMGGAGVPVTTDTVMGLPPAFAAIRYISEGVAMLDRTVKKRKKQGIYECANHPVARLMRARPHPHYSWFDLLQALIGNACLGNGYALIHRDELMRPYAVEHVPAYMVNLEHDQRGHLWYYVSGQLGGRSVSKRFAPTDVIHIKGVTLTGVQGEELILVHKSAFGAGIAARQYGEHVWANQARPSLAVKYAQPLTAEERRELANNLKTDFGGAQKAGLPLVLDDGMDLQFVQWSPSETQFIDFSKLSVQDASLIFKVPVEMLTNQGTGTYGGRRQNSLDFLTHCLGPWIEKIQEEFNAKLFYTQEFESGRRYFEFDTSMYLSLDKKTEADTFAQLIANSILTPNEARKKLGLNPEDGGDVLYCNYNLIPIKSVTQVAMARFLSSTGEKAWDVQKDAANSLEQDANKTTDDEQQQEQAGA